MVITRLFRARSTLSCPAALDPDRFLISVEYSCIHNGIRPLRPDARQGVDLGPPFAANDALDYHAMASARAFSATLWPRSMSSQRPGGGRPDRCGRGRREWAACG